jgi:hypothetical protein
VDLETAGSRVDGGGWLLTRVQLFFATVNPHRYGEFRADRGVIALSCILDWTAVYESAMKLQ